MTLVSMINGHGFPVIITDRAISDPGNLHSVVLPSTNRIPFRPTPVVEFNVKSVIIKDILCVAFAGKVTVIEQIHAEILDFFRHREVTTKALNELLGSIIYSDNECSVLFALGGSEYPGNRLFVARSGNWITDNNRENLDILSGGSGAANWTAHFKENAGYLDESEVSAALCRQRALLTCVSFVNQERRNTMNLMDGWGGGFDIIYYEDGFFHRYDQLAYAFYMADIAHPDRLMPLSVIHNSYQNGNVLVRNMTAVDSQNYLFRQFNDRTHLSEVDSDCASKDVVTCVHLYDGPNHVHDLIVLYWDTNLESEACFYTTRKNGTFGIQFNGSYYNKIIEAIRSFLS